MDLTFGEGLDQGVWLAGTPALDAVTVGPLGLVQILESQLGIVRDVGDPSARVARLVQRLGDARAFYSQSAAHDAWGTARTLLALHDVLWAYGWRGEGLSCRRLEDLAAVTSGVPGGLAQRLETIVGWVGDRRVNIERVTLLDGEVDSAPGWRALWQKLRAVGVEVGPEQPSRFDGSAAGANNLCRSRAADFTPSKRDGSLQLLRPPSTRAAARAVASAWSSEGWEQPLIIGGDAVLDEALAERGLPSLGKGQTSNALLEVLPLVLGLSFGAVDIEKVDQLLRTEPSPVPKVARVPLLRALQACPSVDGAEWRAAMAELCLDPSTRKALDTVFVSVANDDRAARMDLLEGRLDLVERWAEQLASTVGDAAAVVTQVARFRRQVQHAGLRKLSSDVVMALANEARVNAELPARPPTAGLHALVLPDGMLAPARRVVWWGFTAASATSARLPLLRPDERAALLGIGVQLPSAATLARTAASRMRRPWQLATEQLLLVCPWRDDAGESQSPHPLWDEITSNLADRKHAALLEVSSVMRTRPRRLRQLPPRLVVVAERNVLVPHLRKTPIERTESPTSVTSLLGCSFRYAASYGGQLRSRVASAWSIDARVLGLASHTLLSLAVADGILNRPNPTMAASTFFDSKVARVCGLLLRPDAQPERLHVRAAFVGAIELLAAVCRDNGLRLESSEVSLQGRIDDIEVQGTPDLVLVDDRGGLVIVDFKWGGESFRRDELRDGVSQQLATYAALEKLQGKTVRAAGYLILGSQQLMLVGDALRGAQRINGPALGDIWAANQNAIVEARTALGTGAVVVAGVSTEQQSSPTRTSLQSILGKPRLVVAPPCDFCDLSVICGRRAQQAPQ